jgi:hypothetical protein
MCITSSFVTCVSGERRCKIIHIYTSVAYVYICGVVGAALTLYVGYGRVRHARRFWNASCGKPRAWLEARVRSENESCEEGRGILENVSGGYKACDIVEGGGDIGWG